MKSTWSLNSYQGDETKDIQSTLRFLRHSGMPLDGDETKDIQSTLRFLRHSGMPLVFIEISRFWG